MNREEQFVEDRIENLRSVSGRLMSAKEALEVNGVCPEADLTHEEDPYNVGFLWRSVSNSLHSATDALNGLLQYVEPGGLKDVIDESGIGSSARMEERLDRMDENEEYKTKIESTEKLEDDGK